MSEADKLFEELGYKKVIDKKEWLMYRNNEKDITFSIKGKIVEVEKESFYRPVTMQELKAINKKCEELRMDIEKQWREIKGYEGKYIISNYGEIISLPRYKNNNSKLQYVEPKEIYRYVNLKNGYVYVQLWNNGKYKNIRLHRLVAETFIPNIKNKSQINHIDGNRQNNKVNNLEWCTASENIIHSYKMRKLKGVNNERT